MSGAIHPLPQYAFMAWCLVKAQGQLYLLSGAHPASYPLNIRGSFPGALKPIQPPIQWIPLTLSPGVLGPQPVSYPMYTSDNFPLGPTWRPVQWKAVTLFPRGTGAHPASYPMDTSDNFPLRPPWRPVQWKAVTLFPGALGPIQPPIQWMPVTLYPGCWGPSSLQSNGYKSLFPREQIVKNRDSSVGTEADCGLDNRMIEVRIPVRVTNFSL
jgi:hypothetical protein